MKKVGWITIALFGGGCYLILIWMCFSQLRQSNDISTRSVPEIEPIPTRLYVSWQVADTVVDSAMMTKLDSVITAINDWNRCRDQMLINGLDNLRQETNNVIDKQNGWLSFWLAILALVGGVFPIAIQFKVQHDEKQRVEKTYEELNKLKKEQEKSKLYAEISKLSFTLINCQNNRWSRNSIHRNDFWNDMLVSLCKQTNKFVDSVLECDNLHDEYLFYLKMVLVQLHAVYSIYIPIYSQSYKSRQLLVLTSEIASILGRLTNNQYTSVKGIHRELEVMQMHMSAFSL